MSKSSQAFRTIREVADWLGVAAHVLRFWESKFPQIKPVKRAGGRRYYRPADMELVGGIKVLLHDRGLTIRGVQKMIREEGVAAIATLSPPMEFDETGAIEGDAAAEWIEDAAEEAAAPIADRPATDLDEPEPEPEQEPQPEPEPEPEPEESPEALPDTMSTEDAPAFSDGLARLGERLNGSRRLGAGERAWLGASLAALRDRLASDPPT
ncbi:MerR family transcriptional regulator [Rhodobacterales bacterium HKCCSP123]|nr:MerR family transcriptional regulator [Rhodobacterales bacterium HKCCSP123]